VRSSPAIFSIGAEARSTACTTASKMLAPATRHLINGPLLQCADPLGLLAVQLQLDDGHVEQRIAECGTPPARQLEILIEQLYASSSAKKPLITAPMRTASRPDTLSSEPVGIPASRSASRSV
jgi:hypothetical protein